MPIDRNNAQYITGAIYKPTQTSAPGVWDLDDQANNTAKNLWPLPPQAVQRSLRFNSADSAYLNRTPVASNRTTWTWSGWLKVSTFGTYRAMFARGDSYIYFNANNKIEINLRNAATNYFLITTPVYRDPSAWYHIVVTLDTNNGVAADRLKLYVNNVRVEQYDMSTYQSISAGYEPLINSAAIHYIGGAGTGEFNGYMAEVNFVDGQALTPASFGETDQQTGVWIPKRYLGTYGTNGFRLSFANNSSTTALGYDSSGQGNNWTTNNFSVTPGVGNDVFVDVPSMYNTDTGLGGEVLGNYCVFSAVASNMSAGSITNGGLEATAMTGEGQKRGSLAVNSGKWYWEVVITAGQADAAVIGVVNSSVSSTASVFSASGIIHYYSYSGNKYVDGTASAYGATYTTNDVIGVALNMDAGTITFYKNNVSQGTISLTSITNAIPMIGSGAGSVTTTYAANFGQRPFVYTAPSGFKALCTTNLPAPAIGQTSNNQADNHFNVVTYSGNGSTQNLTTDFAPDLVWIKNRTTNYSHMLYDTLRGASTGSVSKVISSNATDSEGIVNDNSTYGYLSSFNANGFTVTAGSFTGSGGYTNTSGQNYVAWCWNAGGVSVTNSAGTNGATIASIYRANRAAGFSIVTYTGNGVDGATVAHGLGTAPAFIIVKSRSNAFNWGVWHKNLAKYDANHAYAIGLNITRPADATAQYAVFYPGVNTVNVFGLGNEGTANQSNSTYVAYCFAEVSGFSAFGSYTGNGSSDGPFIYLGFRPAFLLFKNISQTYGWQIFDYKRNPNNRVNLGLYPNVSNAEGTEAGTGPIDFLSNGFKIRDATWEEINGSTRTYIYAAFAETPARLSTAR